VFGAGGVIPPLLGQSSEHLLGRCVGAFAILGPVERKSGSHKPVSDIRPTDGADRHRALVSVAIYLDAFDGAMINELEQPI
jgi:hypothetical protein